MDRIKIIFFIILLFSISRTVCAEETKGVARDVVLDKEHKTISYTLNCPAFIRIRLGTEEGPLYQTLVNWENKDTGRHVETYYGLDDKGIVFTFNYFTQGDEDRYGLELGEILPSPAQLAIGKTLPVARLNQLHKNHAREICHDPKIILTLKGAKKNGMVVVKNDAPLKIEIDKKDKAWFTKERFQVHIFLDDVVMQTDLDGYTPYVWNFSPKDLNNGKHVITVNLSGFSDHIGAASLPIIIERT